LKDIKFSFWQVASFKISAMARYLTFKLVNLASNGRDIFYFKRGKMFLMAVCSILISDFF